MKLKSLFRLRKPAFMFLFLVCVIVLAFNRFCFSEEKIHAPKRIFYDAANLYEEGKYDQAIKEYSKLLERGLESGNLYYNLGNCYFKKGELGRAILNYEKAMKLIARDSDLRANYKYAKSLIKGNSDRAKNIWPLRAIYGFSEQFTLDGITFFLFFVYFFTIIVIVAGMVLKINRGYFILIIFILIITLFLGAFSFYNKITLVDKEAIIIKEMVSAKFEPFDEATTHFTLYEGAKVYVISSKEDWCKIKRYDGKAGWVKKSTLELI